MAPAKKRTRRKTSSKSRRPRAKAKARTKPKKRARVKARTRAKPKARRKVRSKVRQAAKPKARRTLSPKARPAVKPKVAAVAPQKKKVEGEEIGKVVGFFRLPGAAIIKIRKNTLKVGDTIWISGHTTDLKLKVESMQIDRQPIQEAGEGKEVGVQVGSKVRRNDRVFKV